jgi:hypothetical protein
MRHLFKDENGLIHQCLSHEIHRGISLVWTYCRQDVPSNKSYQANEAVSCPACLLAECQSWREWSINLHPELEIED